ncbi:MAG TPA: hypothetical protein VMT12_04165 [Syntrophales bacterium]|nr:hypothetical protein [Syntrophales bacterium]
MEDIEKRERIPEVAAAAVSSEPESEPLADTPEDVKEAEEKNAPIVSLPLENLLANKTVILVVMICLVALVAVSAGILIGIAAFKKSAKVTVPPQPVRQTVMTSTRVNKPISSAQKSVMQQAPVTGVEQKRASIGKRHGKKMAKKRNHAAPHHVTQMSGKNLENTMKAAAQGDAEAQYRLGTLYATGEGVKKDRGEANKWFRRAASQGHAKARESLEFIYE